MRSSEMDWLTDRLCYLRGLKSLSDQQALLVLLADKKDRSAKDEKKLATLVRAEKANVKAAKARQEAANLINAEKKAEKEAQRKARNHKLIVHGTLFEIAGLENRSRGELLGMLMAAANSTQPERWAIWKARGDELLAQREQRDGNKEKEKEKEKEKQKFRLFNMV